MLRFKAGQWQSTEPLRLRGGADRQARADDLPGNVAGYHGTIPEIVIEEIIDPCAEEETIQESPRPTNQEFATIAARARVVHRAFIQQFARWAELTPDQKINLIWSINPFQENRTLEAAETRYIE